LIKFAKTSGRREWLTAYAPLLFWTILVLGLGTGFGSMNETSRILGPLLEFLFPSADPSTIRFYQGIIRKFAHVFEYGVLGVLAFRAFRSLRLRVLWSVLLVALIAVIDEFNQSFNPARTSTPWDVALDVTGGILAIVMYRAITSHHRHQRKQAP
jgi:VanZ family protein